MEIEQLKEGLSTVLIEKIKKERADRPIATYLRQYKPEDHDILDKQKRPDKIINTGTEEKPEMSSSPVNRIPSAFQKRIVRMAATFLCGTPIQLEANAKEGAEVNLLSVIKKTWDDNKLDYKSKDLAKKLFSETEVAELWYTEEADPEYWNDTVNAGKKLRFRIKVLANSLGDSLFPVFNKFGDMIAFGRGYTVKADGKDEEHFDLYANEKIEMAVRSGGEWVVTNEKNIIGKIQVIYGSRIETEWHDVQWVIDRQETSRSNHADTNDYNGSPTTLVKGKIEGFSKKGEQGKVLELDNDASAEYMSWDHAPESIKMEQEDNERLIYELTSTPNVSFEKMKGLGQFSGIALKMLFMDAHMKAADNEEIFGEFIQRRINYLKAAHIAINSSLKPAASLSIKPKFEYFLPKNDVEKVDMLNAAKAGGILSQKTAIEQNPLVSDPVMELDAVKADGLNTEFDKP